VQVCIK